MTKDKNGHADLMDSIYKGQRHIYDLTRKYYLFGRDTLIEGLGADGDMQVLEVACGTGRNLAKIGKKWGNPALFGMDISAEMLKSAQKTLGNNAQLGIGDACLFDRQDVFADIGLDHAGFDRIVLSYSLSMIADWEKALHHCAGHLAPDGQLHIVDFGDLSGLPNPFAKLLRGWLAKFHVKPRETLPREAARIASQLGAELSSQRGPLGYYQLHVLTAPKSKLQSKG